MVESPLSKPGLALVQIASMAADFLMVRMYDKDRRDAYYRCKACDENFLERTGISIRHNG